MFNILLNRYLFLLLHMSFFCKCHRRSVCGPSQTVLSLKYKCTALATSPAGPAVRCWNYRQLSQDRFTGRLYNRSCIGHYGLTLGWLQIEQCSAGSSVHHELETYNTRECLVKLARGRERGRGRGKRMLGWQTGTEPTPTAYQFQVTYLIFDSNLKTLQQCNNATYTLPYKY